MGGGTGDGEEYAIGCGERAGSGNREDAGGAGLGLLSACRPDLRALALNSSRAPLFD